MKTLDEAKGDLRNVLLGGNIPILFLGAGFSIGAHSKNNIMDGKGLEQYIFDELLEGKVPESDYEEIKSYNLRDLCDEVYSLYKSKEELKSLLIACFKDTFPQKNGFHYKLIDYPWKKIYTVNIDDLVENIYASKGKNLCVQNRHSLKTENNEDTVLYKLHGCVNCPEEGFIFSNDEYLNITTKDMDARVCSFTEDMLNNDIIFVGARLDEPDIEHFLKIYSDNGMKKRNNKLIFIDLNPNRKLQQRVERLGGILIKASAKEFVEYVSDLNFNPSEIRRNIISLNYNGIYRLSDVKKTFDSPYESRIYEGDFCKWQDIYDDWFFKTEVYKLAKIKLEQLIIKNKSICCFCIYGAMFTGKSSILKALARDLEKDNFEVLEYNGKMLSISTLIKYITSSVNTKFVLVVDSGAYYYAAFEKIFSYNIGDKHLVILSAAREYYHFKKRYYLEGNDYCDFYVDGDLKREDGKVISETLDKKSHLLYLASFDEVKRQKNIISKRNIINLILELTYGNISSRIAGEYKNKFSKLSIYEKKLLTELAIFNIADIAYYPRILFAESYGGYVKIEGDNKSNLFSDFVRSNNVGIALRNNVINTYIISNMRKDIEVILIGVLKRISKRVSEKKNDIWYIIFQCLLKDDILQEKLELSVKQRKRIYLSLKQEYKDVSYYWLQLGILSQKYGDYTAAYNYLEMSASIRPNSFKIQHAIARNFLRQANNTNNIGEASALFKNGEARMKALIESKEYYKEKAKAFSVNCYVSEKVHFCNKFGIYPANAEIKYMYTELESVISDTMDPYMDHVCETFFSFLNKINKKSIVRVSIESPLFKYIGRENKEYTDVYTYDPVVESI